MTKKKTTTPIKKSEKIDQTTPSKPTKDVIYLVYWYEDAQWGWSCDDSADTEAKAKKLLAGYSKDGYFAELHKVMLGE